MSRGWILFWCLLVGLWFAPIFPYRLPCANPPYDPGFLATARQNWDREGFLYVAIGGYPLMSWLHALDAYIDPETAAPEQFASKAALAEVERHARGELSPYIRAAPEDGTRLLELYREIGSDRSCEPTVIGLEGDLPAATCAELKADPDWPE